MYLCHCDVPLDLGGIPRTVFESCSVIRTDSLWAASLELFLVLFRHLALALVYRADLLSTVSIYGTLPGFCIVRSICPELQSEVKGESSGRTVLPGGAFLGGSFLSFFLGGFSAVLHGGPSV